MKIKSVTHKADIIIDDYPFATALKDEALPLLENYGQSIGHTNVKATIHTGWWWNPGTVQVEKFKKYLLNEISSRFDFKTIGEDHKSSLDWGNFWGNVYRKGDFAASHHHAPYNFSFAYFLKAKWYDSPLIFTDSGKRIRPKEGRFVLFPSFLMHHVPKHRYKDDRITISGNCLCNMTQVVPHLESSFRSEYDLINQIRSN